MRTLNILKWLLNGVLIILAGPRLQSMHPDPPNRPPQISIVYPIEGDIFSSELIKIKVSATDSDGTISQVRFFADNNLVGVATTPPFAVLWDMPIPCDYRAIGLKAVAIDNLGASTESVPINIRQVCGQPPFTVIQILSPSHNTMFAAPATFPFTGEIVAADRNTRMEFLVGTNSVGVVDTIINTSEPPVSVLVTNLTYGTYDLSIHDQYGLCTCQWMFNRIRVVKLGIQSPRLTPDHLSQFEVLTSFPGIDTVIQTSPNLVNWTSVSTNRPSSTTFTFTETSPATNAHPFYRVVLPSQPP